MGAGRATIRCVLFLMIAVSGGVIGMSEAYAQDSSTASAVKTRYEKLLAEYSRFMMHPTKTSPDAMTFSIKNNMVSKELKFLMLKDEECVRKSGESCNLDFDYLFNSQDACKPLKVLDVSANGKTVILKVSNRFEECDKNGYNKPYDFTLIEESGAWVIDDATYSMKDEKGKIIIYTLKNILNGKY